MEVVKIPGYLAPGLPEVAAQLDGLAVEYPRLVAARTDLDSKLSDIRAAEYGVLDTLAGRTVSNQSLSMLERAAWDLALRRDHNNGPATFEARLAAFRQNLRKLTQVHSLLRQEGVPFLVVPEDPGAGYRPFSFMLYLTTGTGLTPTLPNEEKLIRPLFYFNFGVEKVAGQSNHTSGYDAFSVRLDNVVKIQTNGKTSRDTAESVLRGGNQDKLRFLGKPAINGLIRAAKASRLADSSGDIITQLEQASKALKVAA